MLHRGCVKIRAWAGVAVQGAACSKPPVRLLLRERGIVTALAPGKNLLFCDCFPYITSRRQEHRDERSWYCLGRPALFSLSAMPGLRALLRHCPRSPSCTMYAPNMAILGARPSTRGMADLLLPCGPSQHSAESLLRFSRDTATRTCWNGLAARRLGTRSSELHVQWKGNRCWHCRRWWSRLYDIYKLRLGKCKPCIY